MADPSVLQFGSRAGSYVALVLFCAMFAVLGFGVWREVTRRWPQWRRIGWLVSVSLFAGPVTLIYASSFGGFYEADVRDDRILLHYLYPRTIEIRIADIAAIRAVPAFKGLWRLQVTDTRHAEYLSAASHRNTVQAAVERLRSSVIAWNSSLATPVRIARPFRRQYLE